MQAKHDMFGNNYFNNGVQISSAALASGMAEVTNGEFNYFREQLL